MAYNNSGCNTCTPVCTPPVTAPPVCTGSECEEIYPGSCVAYTGPTIDCLGITTGMSLNEIVQLLAEQFCSKTCCTNPIEWLLQYALDIYTIQLTNGETPNINLIIEELLKRGIIMSNCNMCCPDNGIYLFGNKDEVGEIVTGFGGIYSNGNPNNAYGFADCLNLLSVTNPTIHERFDGTLDSETNGTEWGSISGNTILCIINTLFNTETFDATTLYNIIETMLTSGVAVQCVGNLIKITSFSVYTPN